MNCWRDKFAFLQLSASEVYRLHQNLMFEYQEFFTFVWSVNLNLMSILLFDILPRKRQCFHYYKFSLIMILKVLKR